MKGNRLERVNAEIQRELALIINNELRDPQITSKYKAFTNLVNYVLYPTELHSRYGRGDRIWTYDHERMQC